jgi:hypothetical protein
MKLVNDVLSRWLPLAAVVTALCALVYLAVQQSLRHAANDPQIQLAEDAAQALAQGGAPGSVLPASRVDIAQSLSPFVAVFDAGGESVVSSATLHGKVLHLPAGVFDFVRRHGEHRVSWQPERGVRIASVIVGYGGAKPGFVLSGRSLREAERRTAQLGQITGIAWTLTLASSLILVVLGRFAQPCEGKRKEPAVGPSSRAQ